MVLLYSSTVLLLQQMKHTQALPHVFTMVQENASTTAIQTAATLQNQALTQETQLQL